MEVELPGFTPRPADSRGADGRPSAVGSQR